MKYVVTSQNDNLAALQHAFEAHCAEDRVALLLVHELLLVRFATLWSFTLVSSLFFEKVDILGEDLGALRKPNDVSFGHRHLINAVCIIVLLISALPRLSGHPIGHTWRSPLPIHNLHCFLFDPLLALLVNLEFAPISTGEGHIVKYVGKQLDRK